MLSRAVLLACVAALGAAGAAGTSKWRQTGKLAVRKASMLTEDPACWKRVELRLEVTGTFETPFDPNEIAVDALFRVPSGKTMTVPAFFYQEHERAPLANPDRPWGEVLKPVGQPEWRVRFMPSEPGAYRVGVRARDRSGTAASKPVAFKVRPAEGHGCIRVSRKDPRYFEFEDGTPYFALGENMVGGPLTDYERLIPKLAKTGANYSRLWIGHRMFALELGPIGEYRLDNAWRLDKVIELSEQCGIYQKMCIDWIRNITPRGQPRKQFDLEDYAYSVSNGGPCRDIKDFFTLPEAWRLFQNRLRYTVARWGYSPNVLAWELWNEINAIGIRENKKDIILRWNKEMCRYLKSIDPWRHLTTNSLGSTDVYSEMWEMDENEFAQMHGYYYFSPEAERNARDMAGFMVKWLAAVDHYNKPFIFTEFGVMREKPEVAALGDRDQNGIHLHNGLWAPLAYGAAGTGHVWYWGVYVDKKDLYGHFRAVANFVKDIPWTTAGFQRVTCETNRDNLRVLGLQGKTLTILWVQNKAHTWWNVIHGEAVPAVEGGELTVAGFAPGKYRIEYWDTYEGRITASEEARSPEGSARDGQVRVPLPRIDRDIAIKIISMSLTGSTSLR